MIDLAELFSPASADVDAAEEADGNKDDGDHCVWVVSLNLIWLSESDALRPSMVGLEMTLSPGAVPNFVPFFMKPTMYALLPSETAKYPSDPHSCMTGFWIGID